MEVKSVKNGNFAPPGAEAGWRWRLRHLLPHYRRHARAFAMGFLILVVTNVATAAIPYLMKRATEALESGRLDHLPREVAGLALLGVAAGVLRVLSRTYIYGIGREAEYALRKAYHEKLLQLDAAFFDRERTGDLVARGTSDITSVRMFIGPGFLQISNTLMGYVVVLPIMLGLNPVLTVLSIAPLPLTVLVARLLTRKLYRLSRAVADRFGLLSGFVQESVSGMAVIRGHALERQWRERFDRETEILYRAHISHNRSQSLFGPLMMFSGGIGLWIILAHGGSEVAAGRLTVGDFVAFTGYLTLLVWPTVGFGWILTVLQQGLAALDRLGQVLDTPPSLTPPATAVDTPSASWRGEIRIQGLTFAFPGHESHPVLHDLHLHIPAGAFVGLVGRVGSGKSALLNALARLYPAPPGTILMDGHDLQGLDEEELRHHLVLTPQESFLFSATIRENLLFGRPASDLESAWQAARQAAFDEEVASFPDQMETLVGERGITLSGGQRQRAALARALLLDPRILLLDDVFASVDAATEGRILQEIRQYAQGRTTVMVCHRVAALHHADLIVVLDQGRVAAQGDHDHLMTISPLYRDLHTRMEQAEALEKLQ